MKQWRNVAKGERAEWIVTQYMSLFGDFGPPVVRDLSFIRATMISLSEMLRDVIMGTVNVSAQKHVFELLPIPVGHENTQLVRFLGFARAILTGYPQDSLNERVLDCITGRNYEPLLTGPALESTLAIGDRSLRGTALERYVSRRRDRISSPPRATSPSRR